MAFSFSRPITIDHTKCGAADSTNFPVLVSGVYNGSGGVPDFRTVGNGGAVQHTVSSHGQTIPADLAFYSDAGLTSIMPFEIASYSATTGTIEAWVQVATLSHTVDTVFYVGYGDAAQTTDLSGFGSGTKPWDANFQGVWHFPDGSSLADTDSTANANNGTSTGATAAAGLIGGAASFVAASSQYVDLGSGASLAITGALTLSAWIKPSSLPGGAADRQVIAKDGDTGGRAYNLDIRNNGATTVPRLFVNGGAGSNAANIVYGTVALNTTTWQYLVGTFTPTTSGGLSVYVNGVFDANNVGFTTPSSIPTATAHPLVGARTYAGNQDFFDGLIDEVRIANTVRSAAWILAEFNNQSSPSTFYTMGAGSSIKTVVGLAKASIKTVDGLAIGSVKKIVEMM